MTSGRTARGFALPSAIFLIVMVAFTGSAMMNLVGVERSTASLALQGARAFAAASSGIEWGIYRALDDGSCPADTTLALSEGGLVGFQVEVSCTSSQHDEAGATATVYTLIAVAEYGSFGSPDYVRRRLQVTVTDAS
jgi:MSHA biogenesis protein MshP